MEENPCDKPGVQDGEICEELIRIFGIGMVDAEWSICKDATDDIRGREGERERYCPEIDFVVGPFNTSRDSQDNRRMNEQYDELYRLHSGLLENLLDWDRRLEAIEVSNLSRDERTSLEILDIEREEKKNKNPRCFLAIEIEKTTGPKHVLGGIVNASSLGKIGIVITPEEKYRSTMRIRRYLRFLVAVRKTGSTPASISLGKNTIVLPRAKFLEILKQYIPPED